MRSKQQVYCWWEENPLFFHHSSHHAKDRREYHQKLLCNYRILEWWLMWTSFKNETVIHPDKNLLLFQADNCLQLSLVYQCKIQQYAQDHRHHLIVINMTDMTQIWDMAWWACHSWTMLVMHAGEMERFFMQVQVERFTVFSLNWIILGK